MKRPTRYTSREKDVASENSTLDAWKERLFTQTLRNTGRIEQLEAKQADFEQIKEILVDSWSSEWEAMNSWRWVHHVSSREFAATSNILFKLGKGKGLMLWLQAPTPKQKLEFAREKLPLPYQEKLSKITELFSELEKDFDEIPRRIVRCALLEEELANFESSLEDDETEYLAWYISLIRDVLDYNYAEDLTQTHLELLKKAIDLTCRKGPDCSEEDCQNLHKEFLKAGLALIPTTQKAIDKYGQ
jgi:hypothetical protein